MEVLKINGDNNETKIVGAGIVNLKSFITDYRDSLRGTILSYVAEYRFDLAHKELKLYYDFRSDIAAYRLHTSDIFEHCHDTIDIIEPLMMTEGVDLLPRNRREKLNDRIKVIFRTLESLLAKIEQIEYNLKVKDIQSTLWVLRTAVASIITAFTVVCLLEGIHDLYAPMNVIITDFVDKIVSNL